MANTLTFNQIATVLNSIVSQATGQASITPTDTASFVAVAQTGLLAGYDPLMNAISQVLTRTVFSVRPYTRKFKGLEADAARYGNHIRKLQIVDREWQEDDRVKLVDGQPIDQYTVRKPQALQTNFYGENVVEDYVTIFKDQLDVAFSGPEEFAQFISMVMQNMSDRIEQKHETLARGAVANFMAGKSKCDATNVLHLVTLYNGDTGSNLDSTTVYAPANFENFAKWLMGYLKTVSDLMSERSAKFHMNFTGKTIMRHTPLEKQKIYLYTKDLNNIDTRVLSGTFHDDYLKVADHEAVNFWQAIDSPLQINATPAYNNADGTVATPVATTLDNVFGVIMDEEAVGYTTINNWSAPTPFNARGGYSNMFWHFTDRYWNDFTENAVVLIMD